MNSISTGLGNVIHGLDDEIGLLGIFSLIGLILGWRLGSRMPGWKKYIFWGMVSVIYIFLSSGHLWLSGVEALRSGAFYIAKYFSIWITHLREEIPADIIPSIDSLSLSWSQFSVALYNHWGEIFGWFENLLLGKPSFKPGAVLFMVGEAQVSERAVRWFPGLGKSLGLLFGAWELTEVELRDGELSFRLRVSLSDFAGFAHGLMQTRGRERPPPLFQLPFPAQPLELARCDAVLAFTGKFFGKC